MIQPPLRKSQLITDQFIIPLDPSGKLELAIGQLYSMSIFPYKIAIVH